MILSKNMRKYRNVYTEYNGVTYHSRKEAEYARELDLRVRGKDIAGWTRQVAYPIRVNEKHICNYIVDFVVRANDGSLELHEVKGVMTSTFVLKWKLVQALYGDTHKMIIIGNYPLTVGK